MFDPDRRKIGILLASITALLWGFLAIALKVAVEFISPQAIVWFRFLIAFTTLFIFFIFNSPNKLVILRRPPLILIVAAICLGLNYIGFMFGIHLTSPGNTQIIIQLGPILLALVGIIFFRETLSKRQLSGFLIAGVGFIVFYNDQLSNLLKDKDSFNIGIIIIVLAAISWVIFASLQKKLVQQWDAQQLNLVIYGIPIFMFLPFVEFESFIVLKTWQWILMIFLGLNTLVAYGALSAALKYVEANKVSIIITVNPVITFIVMAILEKTGTTWIEPEVISWYGFGGALLVLTGVVLAVRPSKKKPT